MQVAVLGASNKTDRYSYKAVMMLRDHGHVPIPVHPALSAIEGIAVVPTLGRITAPVDTITVYLSPANQAGVAADMLASPARRIIFNPGTENPELEQRLTAAGKQVLHACTLVMLTTGQF